MNKLDMLYASLKSQMILIKSSPETQGWRFKEITKIKQLIKEFQNETIFQNNDSIECDATTRIIFNAA